MLLYYSSKVLSFFFECNRDFTTYADDSGTGVKGNSTAEIIPKLEEDGENVLKYLKRNIRSFHFISFYGYETEIAFFIMIDSPLPTQASKN